MFRITLAVVLFFSAHVVAIGFASPAVARELHVSYFGFKFLLFIPLFVGCFFINRDRMREYADTARVISLIFLVVQAVAIVDYAYRVHLWMIEKREKVWDAINLGSSAALFVTSIIVIGFLFDWFTTGGDCHVEKFVISTVVISATLYTWFALTETCEHGALFPCACITAYAVWVCYTALISDPRRECNTTIRRAQDAETWQLIVGVFFAAISVTFVCWALGDNASKLFGASGQNKDDMETGPSDDGADTSDVKIRNNASKSIESGERTSEDTTENLTPDELSRLKFNALVFHGLMAVAGMYTTMLLTSWTAQDYTDAESRQLSYESFWVKVVSLWLIIALFVWTLAAPVCFPDRDFSG